MGWFIGYSLFGSSFTGVTPRISETHAAWRDLDDPLRPAPPENQLRGKFRDQRLQHRRKLGGGRSRGWVLLQTGEDGVGEGGGHRHGPRARLVLELRVAVL